MSILGIESVVFGVEDVAECNRFWEDFGLRSIRQTAQEGVFDVLAGSRIIVRHLDDPRLPPKVFEGSGARLTIWGVDTQENMDAIVAKVAADREVHDGEDGAKIAQAPDGQWFGVKLWNKKSFVSVASPVNTPSHYPRLNQHRIWRHKAIPKTINHIVFFSPDFVGSFEFYRDRLGFRYSDHNRGIGIFARADGTYEHHSIFWVNSDLPFAPDGHNYMHIAFGVDDLDELMLGANIMERRGWKNMSPNSSGGISRHRVSSAIYYYVDNPCGGEAEYHADTDYIDDNWVPRAWGFKFGSLLWSHNTPPIFRGDNIPWEMEFDQDMRSFDAYRKATKEPLSEDLAAITHEDEHAL